MCYAPLEGKKIGEYADNRAFSAIFFTKYLLSGLKHRKKSNSWALNITFGCFATLPSPRNAHFQLRPKKVSSAHERKSKVGPKFRIKSKLSSFFYKWSNRGQNSPQIFPQ